MEIFIVIVFIAILAIIPLALVAGGVALLLGAVEKIFYNK
jgi:hypothetical protein